MTIKIGWFIYLLSHSGIGTVTISQSSYERVGDIEYYGGGEGIVYERDIYLCPSTIKADLWWRPSMKWLYGLHLKTIAPR